MAKAVHKTVRLGSLYWCGFDISSQALNKVTHEACRVLRGGAVLVNNVSVIHH